MAQQAPAPAGQVLIRPDQVEGLPFISQEQKTTYKNGLTQLWSQLESHPQGSPQYQEVMNKLRSASAKLMQQLANKGNRPPSQGRPGQPSMPQHGASGNAQQPGNPQPPNQLQQATGAPNTGTPNISQAVRAELQQLKVNVPPNVMAQGHEPANAYKRRFLQHIAGLMSRREAARSRGAQAVQAVKRLQSAGQTSMLPELQQAVNAAQQEISQLEQEIRTLKAKNDRLGTQGVEMQRQGSLTGSQPQQAGAQQQVNGVAQPPQAAPQPSQAQQQQQTSQPQPQAVSAASAGNVQQTQGDVKAKIEQQRPSQSPAQPQGAFQQQQQQRNVQAATASSGPQQGVTQATATAMPTQQRPQNANAAPTRPQQNFKQQQNMPHPQQGPQRPPQINTQQLPQQIPQQQQPVAQPGNPPSAVSQGPNQQVPPQQQQRPQPLTHQAAVNQAAESYSRQQSQTQISQQQMPQGANGVPLAGPPNSAGAGQTPPSAYPAMTSANPQSASTKFPIPKNLVLDPRTQNPAPGPPSRPTLGTTGMMQQPGTQRAPAFTLEGEGDRVLSKRKLDELVRQVTGGGEDGALAPDVEEAVLTLADDFVDNVITAACRLAKLRTSQTLDIRDIQIVLERNYGIRIPGYSLDEVRTVRKFQPAPGWQSKMQAIQAGKVMGNKET